MAASKKQPPKPADDGLVVHVHVQTPQEVAEYWTDERVDSAAPLPMPKVLVPPPTTGGTKSTPKKGKN